MNSRRDAIYKQLFSHPEIVRDLLAGFLSADWAQALQVAAFERVNASYASEQGMARHEDVVWRARIGGEWVYVYCDPRLKRSCMSPSLPLLKG